MSFKEELERIFIPGYTYKRVDLFIDPHDLVFTHFEPIRQCTITCHGEIGQCDGTRLNFKNYPHTVCPYSNGHLRFKSILKQKSSNMRW